MTVSPSEQVAQTAIKTFYQAIQNKDIALLRSVVTPDWEYLPEPRGATSGPDQMIPIFHNLATALPDMHIEILDLLIHGDRVGVRAEVGGTQSGQLLGIAASSKHITFAIHSFHQMRDDRVAKTWHLEDWLAVFRQLGELPRNLDPD
ncbi:ester cyclase [Paraburkholderia sp. BCC1885]|uniref:ester cyclase n=1 Tax=Paraburkholderia sp. BCC1885 TaxID=2562669 RepID=UPI001182F4B9|nr:ester cyclase [Paraburkholderia sp. BCC1885]